MFPKHNVVISPLERNLQYSSPQCNRIGEEFNFKSVREKSDGNAGGRICHPLAVGEMWLPRAGIRRWQETLPSVRHQTAP